MSETLPEPIFKNFQSNRAVRQALKQKLPLFTTIKVEILFESVSRSSILLEIVENQPT